MVKDVEAAAIEHVEQEAAVKEHPASKVILKLKKYTESETCPKCLLNMLGTNIDKNENLLSGGF